MMLLSRLLHNIFEHWDLLTIFDLIQEKHSYFMESDESLCYFYLFGSADDIFLITCLVSKNQFMSLLFMIITVWLIEGLFGIC